MTGKAFDVPTALQSDQPEVLMSLWRFAARRRQVGREIGRAQKASEQTVAEAQSRVLGELPVVSALEALQANKALVDLLTGKRWIDMQYAREEGASWNEIGVALGMSKQAAYDYFQRKAAELGAALPDLAEVEAERSTKRGPVHMRDGYSQVGSRWRAYCSCGHSTTLRTTLERATAALVADHPMDAPVCSLCESDRGPAVDSGGRWRDLEILTIEPGQSTWSDDGLLEASMRTGAEQVFVCRTEQKVCRDLAQQRLLHLDRAAFEGLGLEFEAPPLRSIDSGLVTNTAAGRRPSSRSEP